MKKFPKNFFNEFFEQCHSAEKCKKHKNIHCVAKHQKKLKGDPLGKNFQSKKFQKVA